MYRLPKIDQHILILLLIAIEKLCSSHIECRMDRRHKALTELCYAIDDCSII